MGKEVIDFVAHLETLRTDARTNDGVEVFGLYAVGGFQYLDVAFNDEPEIGYITVDDGDIEFTEGTYSAT